MNIAQLNTEFGLKGHLQVIEGKGGLPFIAIDNGKAKALISLYAAQVLSYQPNGASDDVMFCSDLAYYQTGKAIKGGAPLCWPWFGADPESKGRPAHGFARNSQWQLASTGSRNGNTLVTMVLRDNDATRALWPHAFELALEVTVGDSLDLALVTRNKSTQTVRITQALHTYFKVGDIHQTRVLGLDGVRYLDKVANFAEKTQQGAITVNGEVDRVYTDVSSELVIDDAALGRQIHIRSSGSKTAVVWNPWAEICAGMADLRDDAYTGFICVETANAAADVIDIPANGEYRLVANYQLSGR